MFEQLVADDPRGAGRGGKKSCMSEQLQILDIQFWMAKRQGIVGPRHLCPARWPKVSDLRGRKPVNTRDGQTLVAMPAIGRTSTERTRLGVGGLSKKFVQELAISPLTNGCLGCV